MYVCVDCGYKFETAETITETHGLNHPPYEKFYVCPACQSQNFHKQTTDYCRYCGVKLPKGTSDYCGETCARRGRLSWLKEKRRKKRLLESDIFKKVRDIDLYNSRNHTKYSYGQYVALIDGRGK